MVRGTNRKDRNTSSRTARASDGALLSTETTVRDVATPIARRENNPIPNLANGSGSGCNRRLPMPITPTGSIDSNRSSSSLPSTPETPNRANTIPSEEVNTANANATSYDLKSFMDEQRSFNDRVLNLLSSENVDQPRARTRKERIPLGITVRSL